MTENCLILSKMELIGLSPVCHGNFTSKKSMIPMFLKHQNWAEPLSGNEEIYSTDDCSKGGSSMTRKNNYAGGLSNYIVLKEEKEVIFYLHNPYPDCLEIPAIMKQRFQEAVSYTHLTLPTKA